MNTLTGEIMYKKVTNTHTNHFDPVGLVSLTDETDGSEMHLSTTASHPFHHSESGWIHASLLKVGDTLTEDDGGTLTITAVTFNSDAPINLTYNLEVADFHNFFVGEDGVLVHNAKGGKNRTPGGVRGDVADEGKDFERKNPDCSDSDILDHIREIFGDISPREFKSLMKFLRRANKKKRNSRGF